MAQDAPADAGEIQAGMEARRAGLKEAAEYGDRKASYRFGTKNLQIVYPSGVEATEEGQPTAGSLTLDFAHGYAGQDKESRMNIAVSKDGRELIYYVAAVGIVKDIESGRQRFFFGHNDDISALAIDPKKDSTWIATGQVDPKDRPGADKDLPKVFVWDYTTMETVQLVKDVAWGKVRKIAFSPMSKYMFTMGGDEDHSLRIWDTTLFGQGQDDIPFAAEKPLYKEDVLGFAIKPCQSKILNIGTVDEFLVWGKRKTSYGYVKEHIVNGRVKIVIQFFQIPWSKLLKRKQKMERAFTTGSFVWNGNFVVGSASGAVYLGDEGAPLLRIKPFESAIGGIQMINKTDFVAASFDGTIKKFRWVDQDKVTTTISVTNAKNQTLPRRRDPSGQVDVIQSSSNVDLPLSTFQPRAIAYNGTTDQVFVGSKSNQIFQYDFGQDAAGIFVNGHSDQIWALATHPTQPYYVTGGYDNRIRFWDAQTAQVIQDFTFYDQNGDPQNEHVVSAAWSANGKLVAVGTESSKVALFTWQPEFKLQEIFAVPKTSVNAQVEAVSYLRFSPNNKLLAAAHFDENVYVWTMKVIRDYKKVEMIPWKRPLGKQTAAATHVQFSADSTMIKVFARDYGVTHYKLDDFKIRGKFTADTPDPDTVKWGDDPLIGGWDVQGCYQKEWDGTDLNDVTVTSSGDLLASGDDFGIVRLHNYPVLAKEPHEAYQAHSAFVVGVEFLRDDSNLITVGGADNAIFQWRLQKGE